MHTTWGGKGGGSSLHSQCNNENTKGVYSGKGKTTKTGIDLGATPKTQTQLDDFLDKISMT